MKCVLLGHIHHSDHTGFGSIGQLGVKFANLGHLRGLGPSPTYKPVLNSSKRKTNWIDLSEWGRVYSDADLRAKYSKVPTFRTQFWNRMISSPRNPEEYEFWRYECSTKWEPKPFQSQNQYPIPWFFVVASPGLNFIVKFQPFIVSDIQSNNNGGIVITSPPSFIRLRFSHSPRFVFRTHLTIFLFWLIPLFLYVGL